MGCIIHRNDRREECFRFASGMCFTFVLHDLLVHPRPRINLDLNFGEAIGGRITVEVYCTKRL